MARDSEVSITAASPASDPREKAVRAGLGYLEFALARPALFRLIFSSARPGFTSAELDQAAGRAYDHLVGLVAALGGDATDVLALWATAHGIADLSAGGRCGPCTGNPRTRPRP